MIKKAAIIINFNAWTELSTNTTISFLKSIVEKTDYQNYEIILYENNSNVELLRKVFDYINTINNICIKLISPINKVFYNMDKFYDDATKITDAEIFVFANDDMKIINKEWLTNAIKWFDKDSNIGLICPHTNITYGRIIHCQKCSLIELEKHHKQFSCLFTEGCTKRHKPENKVWYRDWASMGIYICKKETLQKIGMHDSSMDLHGQDMHIMMKFENAGFKVAVAMDSLVEHYDDNGHLTLDYIARDGTNDYNFRAINAYKNISEYLKKNERVSMLHQTSRKEWDKWYNDYYINQNSSFSREEYNNWIKLHEEEWKTDIRYGHATIAVICNLQNSEITKLTINAIESIINSIKYTNKDNSEIIIYENNSEVSEKVKLFEYLNKMKLKTEVPIKWISINHEKFNINKVYNKIANFTRNEILCFSNQDIEVINKEWLSNAMNWLLYSEYRNEIGILLTSAHESVPSRHDDIRTIPEHKLNECGDTPMPIFFIKKNILSKIGGFDEDFPFAYADASLYEQLILNKIKSFMAKDVLIKHYETRCLSNPKGEKINISHNNIEDNKNKPTSYELFKKKYKMRIK